MAKKRTSKKKTAKRAPRKKATKRGSRSAKAEIVKDDIVEADVEFEAILEELLPRQREFLLAFYTESTIAAAAREIGVSRQAHHDVWMAKDRQTGEYRYPLYVQLFNDARNSLVELAEAELFRRGVRGVEEPIVYKGEIMADSKVIKYDTTALIFWLKGNCPEKYKERFEHTGADGGPMTMTIDAARQIADNFDRRHRQLHEGEKR